MKSQTGTNAPPCSKNCYAPNRKSFTPPLRVTCKRANERFVAVLAIEEVCTGCGVIFSPAEYSAEKWRAYVDDLERLSRARRPALPNATILGKAGDCRQFNLPSWYDVPVAERLHRDTRDRRIISQPYVNRRNALAIALCLDTDVTTRTVIPRVVPTLVGDITLDIRIVGHLANSPDWGHNELASVTLATLCAPLEVWENNEKVRFLSLYRIEGEEKLATHIVIVNRPGKYLHSAYVDDSKESTRDTIEDRTNKKRSGILVHRQ
jgi:hypothetical protein